MWMLNLDPIRERLERRTQGEWIIAHGDDETQDEIYVIDDLSEIDEYPSTTTIAEGLLAVDSRFIANALTDIAALIEEVEQLREAVDDLCAFVPYRRSNEVGGILQSIKRSEW